jgi:hypothetical protein
MNQLSQGSCIDKTVLPDPDSSQFALLPGCIFRIHLFQPILTYRIATQYALRRPRSLMDGRRGTR